MTGRDVICIAPTEWRGAWQRYHEIMRRLVGAGNRVLVVENLFRAPPPLTQTVRAAPRTILKAWQVVRQANLTAREVAPGIRLVSPPLAPGPRAVRVARAALRAALRRSVRAHRSGAPVLWCAFPSPMLDLILDEVRPKLIVYDCASSFADDPAVDVTVVEAERALLKQAQLVFTDSRNLWQRHVVVHRRCVWVPTGVDAALFVPNAFSGRPAHDYPVIGYIGTLHAWVDIDLIVEIARAYPKWTFEFVGPRRARADLRRLERLPNVRLREPVPHDALPAIVHAFSVAWIPYKLTPFTNYVFPTKLLEYLAAGVPVVSTDLPEVRSFTPPVRIGLTPGQIARQIEACIVERPTDLGLQIAGQFDWTNQMRQIHAHLDAALTDEAQSA